MDLLRLKNDIDDLSVLLRLRYIFCTSSFGRDDFRTDIVERTDAELKGMIADMFNYYNVNADNYDMFNLLFWNVLSENSNWKDCLRGFGSDFNFTEEMLKEMINEVSK